jgi:hypothetical protein
MQQPAEPQKIVGGAPKIVGAAMKTAGDGKKSGR